MDDDRLDFLEDRRKFPRFSSSAFLGVPVNLKPLPPFFGVAGQGQLIDLSAGGMSVLMGEMIPKGTKLHLELTFPDRTVLVSNIRICYARAQKKRFLIGLEFLNLPDFMENKIARMTKDFLACESRIQRKEKEICLPQCAFFTVCDKPQKDRLEKEAGAALQMKLKNLD